MRGVLFSLLLILLSPGTMEASEAHMSLLDRVLHPFRSESPSPELPVVRRTGGLTLMLTLQPIPVKLPVTRQIKATLDLMNRSRRSVRLEFPTTQRIEALLREKNGKPLVQWSEDQAFSDEPGFVMINPGEHLAYVAMLPTRDLVPGRLYEVEVFLPNYRDYSVTKSFVPVR